MALPKSKKKIYINSNIDKTNNIKNNDANKNSINNNDNNNNNKKENFGTAYINENLYPLA
jgi:hypothetical protein